MPFTRAGHLARPVTVARPGDPLSLVAENLRTAPAGVLPVLDQVSYGDDQSQAESRIVGLINSASLARVTNRVVAQPSYSSNGYALSAEPEAERDPLASLALEEIKARDIMTPEVPIVPGIYSLENTLVLMDRYRVDALPVLDEAGYYRGVVSRADVLSAMSGGVRPPVVGGMATPLGVWLTDGRLTGGVSNLGLFLSGVTLAMCIVLSDAIPQLILASFNAQWATLWTSGRLTSPDPQYGFLGLIFSLAHGFLFLLSLRLLPMAGYHAAEHQTVWALERGVPLEPEYVSRMPRAHPRCGTNLMAISGIILVGAQHLPVRTPTTLLLLLIAAFFLWRSLGTWMQNELTTRTASRRQLESGIKAAKELVAKYQEQPDLPAPLPLRLLNSGMVWSALGMTLTLYSLDWLRFLLAQALVSRPLGP